MSALITMGFSVLIKFGLLIVASARPGVVLLMPTSLAFMMPPFEGTKNPKEKLISYKYAQLAKI